MLYLEILSAMCRVVMIITTIYLFISGVKQRESNKEINSFWYLSILSLLDSCLYIFYIEIFKNINGYFNISKWWQLIYILIEFIIISNFLLTTYLNEVSHINSREVKLLSF